MRFGRLILRNIVRNKVRTSLTMLGIAVSIFIFAALLSLDQGVRRMVDSTGSNNVLTVFERYKACPPTSRIPVHYADKMAELPGVEDVMPVRFLLSTCRTTTDLVAIHGITPSKLRHFSELAIPEEQYNAFADERGAAIVGRPVAERYGWRIGDAVTLTQLGGVSFTVRGIYDAPGSSIEQVVLVDRAYLELAIDQVGEVTMFLVALAPGASSDSVSAAIDAQFTNYDTQTKTSAEKAFIARTIADFRDMVTFSQLVAYVALVLLLAAVANSVSMSVRDRLREMAIMKLLGFDSDGVQRMVLTEAVITGFFASLLGLALAWAVVTFGGFVISVEGFSITPHLSQRIALLALGAGLLLGYLGAYLPALGGSRMPIRRAIGEVD